MSYIQIANYTHTHTRKLMKVEFLQLLAAAEAGLTVPVAVVQFGFLPLLIVG